MEYDGLHLESAWNTIEYDEICMQTHRIQWNTHGMHGIWMEYARKRME